MGTEERLGEERRRWKTAEKELEAAMANLKRESEERLQAMASSAVGAAGRNEARAITAS